MNRNVKTLLAVSILFGAATGSYEFVLPYYLDERGISFQAMGAIFAIAAAAIVPVRILMGRLADRWGRKPFYGLSLGASAAAMALTPLSGSIAAQSLLKTVREAMLLTRETLHPVVLYEESQARFMRFLGNIRGMEMLMQAGGTLLCGVTLAYLGTGGNLLLAGAMVGLAFVIFAIGFSERPRGAAATTQAGRLRELFSLDMHRNLKVILVSYFIFNIGLTTSHCFIMPLFFSDKFGVSKYAVSWVMVLHRVITAISLLVVAKWGIRNLKAAYIWSLVLEGIILSASALIPGFHTATAVWLFHDLVGAGIWFPAQSQIIQEHTPPDRRALVLGKIQAYGGIGTIIGPWLAGVLSQQVGLSAPFLVSGLLITAAGLALAPMRLGEGIAKPTNTGAER